MKWRYYMDEAPQEPEVAAQLAELRRGYAALQPEQLTVLDPCMGSGHILVYAFDVLMDIYRSVGYTDRDAVQSIMENNLYGLDIDDRAAQLAYFALMMKACEYDRRFLRRGVPVSYTHLDVYKRQAMMCQSQLLADFMIEVVGEKYRLLDMTLTAKDLNLFFAHLGEKDEKVAGWSPATVKKIKYVLTNVLRENGYMEGVRSETLYPVFISDSLEVSLKEAGLQRYLAAFYRVD